MTTTITENRPNAGEAVLLRGILLGIIAGLIFAMAEMIMKMSLTLPAAKVGGFLGH